MQPSASAYPHVKEAAAQMAQENEHNEQLQDGEQPPDRNDLILRARCSRSKMRSYDMPDDEAKHLAFQCLHPDPWSQAPATPCCALGPVMCMLLQPLAMRRPIMVLADRMLKFLKIQMIRNTRMVRSSTMTDSAVSDLSMSWQSLRKEQPHVPCRITQRTPDASQCCCALCAAISWCCVPQSRL